MENIVFLFSSKNPELEKLFTLNGGIVTYDTLSNFEVAVFTPGEDVSPFLYGEKRLKKSMCNFPRDMRENALYRALPDKCPKIGIGRGAQLLCVLNGGRINQHVTGHCSPHIMLDSMTGNQLQVTSYHHQEMVPSGHTDVLGFAHAADKKETPTRISNIDVNFNIKKGNFPDTEVAYCLNTKSLMFQPRPEKDWDSTAGKNTKNLFMQYYEEWILPDAKTLHKVA